MPHFVAQYTRFRQIARDARKRPYTAFLGVGRVFSRPARSSRSCAVCGASCGLSQSPATGRTICNQRKWAVFAPWRVRVSGACLFPSGVSGALLCRLWRVLWPVPISGNGPDDLAASVRVPRYNRAAPISGKKKTGRGIFRPVPVRADLRQRAGRSRRRQCVRATAPRFCLPTGRIS